MHDVAMGYRNGDGVNVWYCYANPLKANVLWLIGNGSNYHQYQYLYLLPHVLLTLHYFMIMM
jgi:hypothetical protein